MEQGSQVHVPTALSPGNTAPAIPIWQDGGWAQSQAGRFGKDKKYVSFDLNRTHIPRSSKPYQMNSPGYENLPNNRPHFTEPEGSLSFSKGPATWPYPAKHGSCVHPHFIYGNFFEALATVNCNTSLLFSPCPSELFFTQENVADLHSVGRVP
jgi:hypothetical protein